MPTTTSPTSAAAVLGWWRANGTPPSAGVVALSEAVERVGDPLYLLTGETDRWIVGTGGDARLGGERGADGEVPIAAYLAALRPENLGDPSFCRDHGLRYAYMAGAMANGIASVEVVEAAARAGMLGSFGAAGLAVDAVEQALDRLQALGELPFAINLIHSPNEPALEWAVVDLYLRRGVRLIEASAFLSLTAEVVRYRVHGIHRGADGAVVTPNRIIAKVSRVEVAEKFFAPPPSALLDELVAAGAITADQARLATEIPMAQDLTAEADSGGHTDNRPALALLPTMLALRDAQQAKYGFVQPLRVGLAGGIATPASAAAAFAMGAAWIVTGSVNQSCVEAGTSDAVRTMLAEARQADVIMAPAADMFEMGVKVQVLKRGTMFAMRGQKLLDVYRAYDSIEAIPAAERAQLEKSVFRVSMDDIWAQTRTFFAERDPREIAKADADPKHKLALVCRWYLGCASHWANSGVADRKVDYQVWCGPAMGAFNEWVRGTFLESPAARRIEVIGLNILHGAAVVLRWHALRNQGVTVPAGCGRTTPKTLQQLSETLS
jgi:trans-AT polyketide synthase/acyltransferase/oxidoreductase domain-containing protein